MGRTPVTTYYLRSFGCQMNDHDSERIAGMLEDLGMVRCDSPDEARVLVYNTCSIREKADSRLAGHLGLVSRLKREDPNRVVVLAGCLPQSRREGLLEVYPFVDVMVGPQSLHDLPALLQKQASSGVPVATFEEKTTRWSADLPRARADGPCAWVQITAGCSNFCSYCIVPYVRGPEASRKADEILREVGFLADSGVREVTFLGQNVNAYGKEPGFPGDDTFAGLMRDACAVRGIERVRFMTSHPKDVSEELIDLMAADNQVCEHVHLPAQSGSDRILAAMGRRYDRRTYVELVERWRRAVPGLAVTTDLIVGFPGESEDDFARTLSLVDECRFDGAFTFIYSPRRGTAAATLPNKIEEEVAVERMGRLVETVQRNAKDNNEKLLGSTVEVLVEKVTAGGKREAMGRTRTYKAVNFPSQACVGDVVEVEILSATSASLRGREV